MENNEREIKKPTQKFYFTEEGKLIVESNKGVWVDGDQYVKMYGKFECNAKTMGEIISRLRNTPVEVGVEEKLVICRDRVYRDIMGVEEEHTIKHYCVLNPSEEHIKEYANNLYQQRIEELENELNKLRATEGRCIDKCKEECEAKCKAITEAVEVYNKLPWYKRMSKKVAL